MELTKLRYFYETAKTEHVTKSAEKLCIAQPALTQAIKSLEKELGVPLFKKKGRNVTLTEYGIFLKNSLDKIIPDIDRIPEDIDALKKGLKKRVRLNILAISSFIVERVLEFRKTREDLKIELEQNETGEDYDIVVSTCLEPPPVRLGNVFYFEEPLKVVIPLSSPLSNREKIYLNDLKAEKFVLLSGTRLFGNLCEKICEKAGFTPETFFVSDSPASVQNVISAGTGVAFWSSLWGKIDSEKVKCLPVIDDSAKRFITVELKPSAGRSAYAAELFGYITEALKSLR